MQIWRWLLVLGLLFLITYNPSSGTVNKYIEEPAEKTDYKSHLQSL